MAGRTCPWFKPVAHYKEPLLLMQNRKGQFADISSSAGDIFRAPFAARGAAFGDLNNDGFLDVAINCNDGRALVLMNRASNGNNWVMVKTVGTRSNRDGIGASIRVVSVAGDEQHGFVSAVGSYASASNTRVHFGLGQAKSVRSIEVIWPSGIVQRLEHLRANQLLTITERGT